METDPMSAGKLLAAAPLYHGVCIYLKPKHPTIPSADSSSALAKPQSAEQFTSSAELSLV